MDNCAVHLQPLVFIYDLYISQNLALAVTADAVDVSEIQSLVTKTLN